MNKKLLVFLSSIAGRDRARDFEKEEKEKLAKLCRCQQDQHTKWIEKEPMDEGLEAEAIALLASWSYK